jgi:hypothetical protein
MFPHLTEQQQKRVTSEVEAFNAKVSNAQSVNGTAPLAAELTT